MANEEAPKTWGKAEAKVESGLEGERTVGPFTEVISEYGRRFAKLIRRIEAKPNAFRKEAAFRLGETIAVLESMNGV